jgi:protein-tyrosine phosphatase
MDKVTNYLYIGSLADVKSLPKDSHEFDLIISLCSDSETMRKYPAFKRIPVIHIDIDDSNNEDISLYFKSTYDLISAVRNRKERVLVHCRQGVSRSATIVIAYLMRKYKYSLNKAFEKLSKIRPIINPNDGFIQQLEEM